MTILRPLVEDLTAAAGQLGAIRTAIQDVRDLGSAGPNVVAVRSAPASREPVDGAAGGVFSGPSDGVVRRGGAGGDLRLVSSVTPGALPRSAADLNASCRRTTASITGLGGTRSSVGAWVCPDGTVYIDGGGGGAARVSSGSGGGGGGSRVEVGSPSLAASSAPVLGAGTSPPAVDYERGTGRIVAGLETVVGELRALRGDIASTGDGGATLRHLGAL